MNAVEFKCFSWVRENRKRRMDRRTLNYTFGRKEIIVRLLQRVVRLSAASPQKNRTNQGIK